MAFKASFPFSPTGPETKHYLSNFIKRIMQSNITIAVIGGTGKSGKYLVKELISKGYHIKLLHRNPETLSFDSPLVTLVKGDARDRDAIANLLKGSYAVISALGQPAGEAPIFSEAARNIVAGMEQPRVSRYIAIAGLNVDTPNDHKSKETQAGTDWMKATFPKTTADRQAEYQILVESKVNWTMVRLPLIVQTDQRGELAVSLTDCPGNKVSAADLADFLIEQLSDDTFSRQAPFIASKHL